MTNELLSVGPLHAATGTKTRGTVPADLGTLTVDLPLTLVNGAHPGPRVLITAGVHGGEFTGIDAATRLASLLEPGQVHGQLIVCPVANPRPSTRDGSASPRSTASTSTASSPATRRAAPPNGWPPGSSPTCSTAPTPTSTCMPAASTRSCATSSATASPATPNSTRRLPRWRIRSASRTSSSD